MATKKMQMSQKFINESSKNVEAALGYMLFSSLGVSLSVIVEIVARMLANGDNKVALFCIVAAVQVRGNVTFASAESVGIKPNYPELIISSTRAAGDEYNFSAAHAAGHLLLSIDNSVLAQSLLSKAGNCVFGSSFPDSVAGKINKEIRSSWAPEEVAAAETFKNTVDVEAKKRLTAILALAKSNAASFRASIA